MTQAKAASLTNELFARKGTASPASLVIAELKEEGGDAPSLPAQRNKGRGSEASERKKASLPEIEQDLPLLAFVDAQSAKDGAGGNAHGETDAGGSGGRGLRGEEGALDPAGSLLVHRPLAFRMTAAGEVDDTDAPTPAAEASPAAAANGAAPAQEVPAAETVYEEVGDDLGAVPAEAVTAVPDTGQAGVAVDWAQALEVVEAELVAEGPTPEEPRPEDPPAEESPIEESEAEEQAVELSPEPLQMPAVDNAAGMGAPDTEAASAFSPASSPVSGDAPAEKRPPAPEDTPAESSGGPATVVEEADGDTAEASPATEVQPAAKDADRPAQRGPDDAAAEVRQADPTGIHKGDDKDAKKAPGLRPSPVNLTDRQRKVGPKPGKAIAGPSVVGPRERGSREGSPWRMAAVVALGIALGFAGYAFWPSGGQGPQPGTTSSDTEVAAGTGAEPAETPEPLAEGADAPTMAAPAAAEVQDTEGAVSRHIPMVPEETAAAEPVPDAATETAAADGGAELPAPASAPAAEAEPSFDIIRIEPNGQSIIAGRAEPFSEWILLNNSEPIGTVRADINGEWVILPGAALVQGANKFSLVPKSEQGAVELPALQAPAQTLPAPTQPAPTQPAEPPPAEASVPEAAQDGVRAPRSDAGPASQGTEEATPPAPGVALPILKPADRPGTQASAAEAPLASDGSYEIQLASVRQSGAADRERVRLIDDYPVLLGDLELRVEEARLDGAGIFYRLRTGPIKDLNDARELCRQLEQRGQGCLVVVRAAEPSLPLPRDAERPAQAAPTTPNAPAAASTQQAENPN